MREKRLTAVTSLMAHSCSSLTFSTKNGVIPIDETWGKKKEGYMNHNVDCSENVGLIAAIITVFTWRMVVSVSSWISKSSAMLLTMSHTLLYNMIITRCLCVEHFARFALELNRPPRWTRAASLETFSPRAMILHTKTKLFPFPLMKKTNKQKRG